MSEKVKHESEVNDVKVVVVEGPKNESGRPHIGCGDDRWCGTEYCMGYC